MNTSIKVLIVDDSEDDAELMVHELMHAGLNVSARRVDSQEEMDDALQKSTWDIILCDHEIPRFSSDKALNLVKNLRLDVPFIIVSGKIGEEHAVAAMRAGCHDYVMKNNIKRLCPVVQRELREAEERRAHLRAEKALRESLQTSADIVRAIPSALFIFQFESPDQLILLDGNPVAENLIRQNIKDLCGSNINEIWPQAKEMGLIDSFISLMENHNIYENDNLYYKDNRIEGTFRLRAFAIPGRRLCVIFDDITEGKRAEEALANERHILRTLIDNLPDRAFLKDTNGQFLLANIACAQSLFAEKPEDIIGKTDFDFMPHSIASKHFNEEQEIIRTGKPMINRKVHVQKPEGNTLWILSTKVPWYDDNGNIVGLIGLNRDITELKLAEESIRASEEAERRFQEKLTVLLSVCNELSTIDTFDELCRKAVMLGRDHLGYDRLGIWFLGDEPDILTGSFGTYKDGQLADERNLRAPVEEHHLELLERKIPYRLVNKTADRDTKGESIDNVISVATAIWDSEKTIGLMMADNLINHKPITHRDCELLALYASAFGHLCSRRLSEEKHRRLEAQIQQAQKLESLGVLAGGIAHDFNNLLTIISGNAQYLRDSITLDPPRLTALNDIETAARHASEMTRSLQAFSRPSKPQIKNTDANILVEEVYRLLRRAIPATIEFKLDLDPLPCTIAVDPGQTQQMLVNLCVNARDAMPSGGVLIIQTRHVVPDSLPVHAKIDIPSDKYIRISVSDTGCGMNQDTIRTAFDPFFTTKPKDRGTGLGLAVVYTILQSHNGVIDIQSQIGKGTTLHIFIPEAESQPAETEPTQLPTARGDERILVVDDEEMIASLIKTLLESRGYIVTVANNPAKAIDIVRSADKPFD
ncbi:MAG: response regulator, partial [Planctomycetota bacterium]